MENQTGSFFNRVEYKLTFEEYLESQRNYIKTSAVTYYAYWVVGLLGIIVGTIGIIVVPSLAASYWAVVLGIFIIFSVTLLHRLRVTRLWKKEPRISMPISIDITDDCLHIISPNEDGRVKWAAFNRYLETKSLFMIFRQRNMFNVIPKRVFNGSEEVDRFRNMLRKKITTNKLNINDKEN